MKKTVIWLVATFMVLTACSTSPSPSSALILERSESMSLPNEVSQDSHATGYNEQASDGNSSNSTSSLSAPTVVNKAEPTISLSADTFKAGDMISVTVDHINSNTKLDITTTLDFEPHFFVSGNKATSMIPAKISTRPSNYGVTVYIDGVENKFTIEVVDADFETETFEVDSSVADSTVNNNNANIEYSNATDEHKASSADEFYAADGFAMPIVQEKFRVSSSFGYTRVINGAASRHGGVDFPAPAGTPVTATGSGKVLFAQFLQLTGNTVIIEHGNGLKSWYYHMSAIDCKPGELLKKGDPVGKVGTTGFSTGNHLHFAMSVNDVYTNPWQFIEKPKST